MRKKEQKKQWHLGFYGAIELEFREDKDSLEFYQEYQLSKKALEMDMLVVRKNNNIAIRNDIGAIFRKHNIIEYKSPHDSLGIDQFYKGIAYVCLYKSLGKTSDEIKGDELTLTFVRETYPAKLMGTLEANGHNVEKRYPGIYYVTKNLMFPVQIVVTDQLEAKDHLSLSVLSDHVRKETAKEFVQTVSALCIQGDKENADAVLKISVAANRHIFDKIKEEQNMNDALRDLMKDEIEEEMSNAIAKGKTEGKLESIRALMNNLKLSAEQAMESIGIPKSDYNKYMQML